MICIFVICYLTSDLISYLIHSYLVLFHFIFICLFIYSFLLAIVGCLWFFIGRYVYPGGVAWSVLSRSEMRRVRRLC